MIMHKVLAAGAFVNIPELVLADEPTGNPHRTTSDQVMALLREINEADQTAFGA